MKKILFLSTLITILFASCAIQKEIERADAVNKQIQSLRDLNQDKIADGSMSPEIGNQIDTSYQKMQQKIKKKKENLLEAQSKKDAAGIVKAKKELRATAVSYQRTIETFLALYKDQTTLQSFESSRFFSPGEYRIKSADAELILKDMDPIIKKLNDKIDTDPNLKIKVALGVYGYTDEQSISKNKPLYKELKDALSVRNPTQKQLNQKLSEFRARELSKLLTKAVDKRKNENQTKEEVVFEINWIGRGYSKLPFRGMTRKKVDEKRRVVTVIWGLVPLLKD